MILTAAIGLALLPACKPSETTDAAETAPPDPALNSYFVPEPPPDAQAIHLARTTAKPGDEITLKGELIGRKNIFVEGRAAFVLGDPEKITSCDKTPKDGCPTPWDACCDSKEAKRIGTASIQILDEDGRVFAAELKGTNGLKELSYVTLRGTVAENSTEENFTVNARSIHVRED